MAMQAFRQQAGTSAGQGIGNLFTGAIGAGAEQAAVNAHATQGDALQNYYNAADTQRRMQAVAQNVAALRAQGRDWEANALMSQMGTPEQAGNRMIAYNPAMQGVWQNNGVAPSYGQFVAEQGGDAIQQAFNNQGVIMDDIIASQQANQFNPQAPSVIRGTNSSSTSNGTGKTAVSTTTTNELGRFGGVVSQNNTENQGSYFRINDDGTTPAQVYFYELSGGSQYLPDVFGGDDGARMKTAKEMELKARTLSGLLNNEALGMQIVSDAAKTNKSHAFNPHWEDRVDEEINRLQEEGALGLERPNDTATITNKDDAGNAGNTASVFGGLQGAIANTRLTPESVIEFYGSGGKTAPVWNTSVTNVPQQPLMQQAPQGAAPQGAAPQGAAPQGAAPQKLQAASVFSQVPPVQPPKDPATTGQDLVAGSSLPTDIADTFYDADQQRIAADLITTKFGDVLDSVDAAMTHDTNLGRLISQLDAAMKDFRVASKPLSPIERRNGVVRADRDKQAAVVQRINDQIRREKNRIIKSAFDKMRSEGNKNRYEELRRALLGAGLYPDDAHIEGYLVRTLQGR